MAETPERINCDECSDSFTAVNAAIQHKFRKHRQSSVKHYCPHCGMQFPIKYCRDKHLEVHRNEEGSSSAIHACSQCEATFYSEAALKYHSTSNHNRVVKLVKTIETPPPSRKIKCNNAKEPQSVYYCHLCGSEYIMKYNLEVHLERQHKEDERNALPEELIKCKMCDALFFNKKAYENHNLFHKSDDIYIENEQQRQTLVTRVDQDFDIRRVQTQAEKYLPKIENEKRGRKRKLQHSTKPHKTSSVRWKSESSGTLEDADDSDCLSSASSISDSEDEDTKPANDETKPVACE